MSVIKLHPFKEAVIELLEKHFSKEIASRFILVFESEFFDAMEVEDIWRMTKADGLVMEVRYRDYDDTTHYIGDLYSWEGKGATEKRLLRNITDKFVSDEIGADWEDSKGIIQASPDFLSRKYETPDEKPTNS